MIEIATVPVAEVRWRNAVRIIRSIHPPIDLFEDIADPGRLAASRSPRSRRPIRG